MSRLLIPVAAVMSLALLTGAEPVKVEQKKAKLDAITAAIAKHKGKVVIVDFWGDFCIPCKKEFPNLVRLHNEHAKDGLVCVSVAVDDPDDADAAASGLKFLQKQKATFENYLIDEKPEVWQKNWGFAAVPAVMVYGRDGKIAKKFTFDDPNNQFTYKDVEKFVLPLLEEKK
jgi:thiol-disulfide isomerase/thioredoxin